MVRARLELFGLEKRAPQDEDERHDRAADEERNAPSPRGDVVRRHPEVKPVTERSGNNDGDLLARRLPTGVETLVAGRRHFSEVDRYAAELGARGKALQQTASQDQQRRRQADGRVTR